MDNIRPLIEEAIRIYGSEAKLAQAAQCSQNSIWAAKRAGHVSAEMAVRIERATNHVIPRWRLRPDLWEPPIDAVGHEEAPSGAPHGHLNHTDSAGKRSH